MWALYFGRSFGSAEDGRMRNVSVGFMYLVTHLMFLLRTCTQSK